MNHKLKNLIIDSLFPLIFWGAVYLVVAVWALGWWDYRAYLSWLFMVAAMTPLNGVAGGMLNRWRRWCGYRLEGYE